MARRVTGGGAKRMEEMLITLPSNSSAEQHPTNKPTEYTVTLRKPIDLDGNGNEWEAALLSMQFTQGWNNVRQETMLRLFVLPTKALPTKVSVAAAGKTELFYREAPGWLATDADCGDFMLANYYDSNTDGVDDTWTYYKLRVPIGYYHSVQQVGEYISKQFEKAYGSYGAHLDMEVDYTTGFVRFLPRGCKVFIFDTSKYLMGLLGLRCTMHTERDFTQYKSSYGIWRTYKVVESLQGTRKPQLDVVHSMYVYSDLIEAQPVGDVEAPLLGIVPIGSAEPGERVHYAFNPLSYLPLSATYVRSICIELRTDNGDPVPFAAASDNVVCCIRLRRAHRSTNLML
jgi:hypothetical protein